MATMLLFSNTVTDTYKETSEAVNSIDLNKRHVIKKTLVDMMKQSFFHGASQFWNKFYSLSWKINRKNRKLNFRIGWNRKKTVFITVFLIKNVL